VSAGVHVLTPRFMVAAGIGRDDYAPLSLLPKAGVSQVGRSWARLCVTWCGVFVSMSAPIEPRRPSRKIEL
jgi:hypothetical protein